MCKNKRKYVMMQKTRLFLQHYAKNNHPIKYRRYEYLDNFYERLDNFYERLETFATTMPLQCHYNA